MHRPQPAIDRPWSRTTTDAPLPADASLRTTTLVVGTATVVSNLAQFGWLVAGSRALPGSLFGDVLSSQALYAVLQILVDGGTFFEGARRSAQGILTTADRRALTRARSGLALAGVAIGLLVMAVGDSGLASTTWPYLVALLLFARLNVWEAYGRGRALPYGAYLGLRSSLLALVVVAVAITAGRLPAEAAGLVECLVIVAVAVLVRRPVADQEARGARTGHPQSIPWRAIFLIGFPSLISQYIFALPTVMLAVSGSTLAAAAMGVGLRVLSGIQGLNGIGVASVYPRMARLARAPRNGGRMAERVLLLIVALSSLALLSTAIAQPILVRLLLGHPSAGGNVALLISVGAAAASGLVLQLTLMLVARGAERRVVRAAVCGALVLTIGAGLVLAIARPDDTTALMAICFAVAQASTVLLLAREVHAHTGVRASDLWLSTGSAVVLALAVPVLVVTGVATRPAIAGFALVALLLTARRSIRLPSRSR